MLFALLIIIAKIVTCSDDGVQYSADGLTLIKGNPKFKTFVVPEKVEYFQDGDENSNCFGNCQQMEQITFLNYSKLKIIGSYSFFKTRLVSIDLSTCLELVEIHQFAFCGASLITIVLPDSVENFGRNTFKDCTKLQPFVFPKKLRKILYWDFFNTGSFTKVQFKPNSSITSIDSEAFSESGVTLVYIPASVTSLSSSFILCPLQEVIIDPDNKKYICDSKVVLSYDRTEIIFAFQTITEYVCDSKLKTVGINSFRSTNITKITLNQGINLIGGSAFRYSALQSIHIPSSLLIISYWAFAVSSISSITFDSPTDISTIDFNAFDSCSKLERIEIPSGVSSIGASCFKHCGALKYIWIPKTVTSLGGGTFNGVSSECNITFEPDTPFIVEDGVLYSANYKSVIAFLGVSGMSEVTINPSTTKIQKEAFAGAQLRNVRLPEGSALSSIEDGAFEGSAIESFAVPEQISELGDATFKNCHQLSSVALPSELASIGAECFAGCSALISVELPLGLRSVGANAFDGSLLESVGLDKANRLESIGDYCFRGIRATNVFLPMKLTTIGFCCFENSEIEIIEFDRNSLLETISESAFCRCKSLIEIYFGNNIKCFGDSSFKECISLKSMSLPETVSIVQMRAFSVCISLSSFKIPRGNLEILYSTTFEGCTNLSSLDVSSLNHNFIAHDGCLFNYQNEKLILRLPAIADNSFAVPSTVKLIGMNAFQGCINLEVIIINEKCEEVGIFAFADCRSLTRLYVPNSVMKMGMGSLQGCTSLGCGGIIFSPEKRDMFKETEVEDIALTPCPTFQFTLLGKDGMILGFGGSVLFVEADSTT